MGATENSGILTWQWELGGAITIAHLFHLTIQFPLEAVNHIKDFLYVLFKLSLWYGRTKKKWGKGTYFYLFCLWNLMWFKEERSIQMMFQGLFFLLLHAWGFILTLPRHSWENKHFPPLTHHFYYFASILMFYSVLLSKEYIYNDRFLNKLKILCRTWKIFYSGLLS